MSDLSSLTRLHEQYLALSALLDESNAKYLHQISSLESSISVQQVELDCFRKSTDVLKQQLAAERAERLREKGEALQFVDDMKQKLSGERDDRAREKVEALQSVDDLKQQLSAERDERARAKVEAELAIDELNQKLDQVTASLADLELQSNLALNKSVFKLHQAQELSEYYFLLSRQQEKLLLSSEALSAKTSSLISGLTNKIS